MSPSTQHAPRTPDRRSSAHALFTAFRSLTGGRLKSATPPPTTSPAVCTPARTPSLGTLRSSAATSPDGPDGSLQRLNQLTALRPARPVTGGPPELDGLMAQLHRSRPLAERAVAVDRICDIVRTFPLRNTLALWAVASDLLLPEQPDDVAEIGYKLLLACASLPDLASVERTIFFDAACLRRADRCFARRLDVVVTLTKGGRDVEACEPSIVPFILTSLDVCFDASNRASSLHRTTNSKRHVANPAPESIDLARLFLFVIDVCKFNAKIFTHHDLDLLLKRAVTITKKTRLRSDIESCVKLFDTIVTYVHLPVTCLRACLEVLCEVYKQLPVLKEQAWGTLTNLFKSHVGHAAISTLLHILLDGPSQDMLHLPTEDKRKRLFSVYKGTTQVLLQLLIENGHNELPKIPMSLLFPALKASIQEPQDREHCDQEVIVMSLIDTVLAQDSMKYLLLAETDFGDMLDIIDTCAKRHDSRLRARLYKVDDPSLTVDITGTDRGLPPNNDGLVGNGRPVAFTRLSSSQPLGDADMVGEADGIAKTGSNESIATPLEFYHRNPDDLIYQILEKLSGIGDMLDLLQREAVMELFLGLSNRVSDSIAEKVISYFTEERYRNPSNDHWLRLCRNLVTGILKDATRPRPIRIMVIRTLRDAYDTMEQICADDKVKQCSTLLLDKIEAEEDIEVLHELVDFAVNVADRVPLSQFSEIVEVLSRRLDKSQDVSTTRSPPFQSHSLFHRDGARFGSSANVISTAFVRLFTRSITHSAQKTCILYESLRAIAGSDGYEHDARLTALKLLFRLRADARHALIVSSSSEAERIAAELCRTEDTAIPWEKAQDSPVDEHARSEDSSVVRESHKTSSSSPHSSLNRHTSRTRATIGRISRPIPPLWMYPGPKGLPEEPTSESSRVCFSHIDAEKYPLPDDIFDMEITLWLELVISLLQRPPDWEIYSYVLVHLGPQLSNQALVRSCFAQLQMLRSVLCEQVRNSSFHEPPPHTLLKKADVAVCLFHVLTVIISYHEHFGKSEEDDLVKAFLQGIVQWDRTSKWCIHALSVCCFEIPLSVSKSLDSIIQKVSQIVTKPATAIHILEFLTSLARLPELFKNFREDEFKLVFGLCFRYLQHIRDQRDRISNSGVFHNSLRALRHSGASGETETFPEFNVKRPRSVEEDLPQYLYSLAYHVITFWFMALKMEDRPKQIPWITKNLLHTDSLGRQVLDEQGEVIVDIMNMVAYTDRDETVRDDTFAQPGDGEIWKKTWIVGNALMTIETAARSGASAVTIRRPCGTRFLTVRPSLTSPPRHQIPITAGLASEAFYSASYVGILPDDIFQSFYAPLDPSNPPIPLPDDDMTRRALAAFDRIATIDSYKVGVIYISEGQTEEREILMNDLGSPAYTSFVDDLGTLCRLKDAKFNTGGLDTRDDVDGEFTYCWRDRCMELVFHITTMMPTNRDDDMTYPNKKRHIGNDFVNIIFNDSGLPYNFDTFPSAFNYVHIVISPESRASFVDRRTDADPNGRERYYKVQAISKPGFPDISPAVETKILCGKYLADYCRLIAINSCVFSSVWLIREGGESISSWRNRLREIKRLRERYGGSVQPISSPSSPTHTQAILSPPPRDHGGVLPSQRTSITPHLTDGTSRSSIISSAHDTS